MARPSKNIWQLKDDSERRMIVLLVLLYGTGGMIDRWYAQFPERHSGDEAKDKALIRDATRKCNPRNESHCSQKWKEEFRAQKCLVDEGRRADLERAVTRVITEIEADLDEVKETDLEKALLLVHKQEAKSKIVSRLIEFQDRISTPHENNDPTKQATDRQSAYQKTINHLMGVFGVVDHKTLDG